MHTRLKYANMVPLYKNDGDGDGDDNKKLDLPECAKNGMSLTIGHMNCGKNMMRQISTDDACIALNDEITL